MNSHHSQHQIEKAPRKRQMSLARLGLMLASVAYFFTALQIAPLIFVWVGAALDSDHQARVSIVDGGICVTLAHGSPSNHRKHKHEWLSDVIVGSTANGHPDHIANFASAGNGLSTESGEVDVKCPVGEMSAFEWLTLAASSHAPSVTNVDRFESLAPLDIRPMRPVVLLI